MAEKKRKKKKKRKMNIDNPIKHPLLGSLIMHHQSRLLNTNDVFLTNHRVCTMMTLNILWKNKVQDFHTETQNSLRSTLSSFKPALVVGGLLKLRYRAKRSQIHKEDRCVDFHNENQRNHYKTPYFMLQYQ